MVLTQKERSLLEDLKGAEQLCIIKYTKYADEACDPCLAELFNSIKTVEADHLATVTRILAGDSVTAETPRVQTRKNSPVTHRYARRRQRKTTNTSAVTRSRWRSTSPRSTTPPSLSSHSRCCATSSPQYRRKSRTTARSCTIIWQRTGCIADLGFDIRQREGENEKRRPSSAFLIC